MPKFSNRNNMNVVTNRSSTSRLNQDILSAKIASFEAENPTNYLVEKTNVDVKPTQVSINNNASLATIQDGKQSIRKSIL